MDSPVNEPHDADTQEQYTAANKENLDRMFEFLKEHSYALPFVTIDLTFYYPDQISPCTHSSTGVTVAFLESIFRRALNTMEPGLIPPHVLELSSQLERITEHNRSVAQ